MIISPRIKSILEATRTGFYTTVRGQVYVKVCKEGPYERRYLFFEPMLAGDIMRDGKHDQREARHGMWARVVKPKEV